MKYWSDRATKLSTHINEHREHLLNYIIFLRITPFLPNWFINITSPIVDVPLKPFFIGTFFGNINPLYNPLFMFVLIKGVAPPSFVAIHAGTTLHELSSTSGIMSYRTLLMLILFGTLSILPIVFKNKLKDKFKQV